MKVRTIARSSSKKVNVFISLMVVNVLGGKIKEKKQTDLKDHSFHNPESFIKRRN